MVKNGIFLYGKNSVSERLKANPKSIRKIFLQANFDVPRLEELIKSANISVKRVSQRELYRIKSADSLQGIIAWVDKFKYANFSDLVNEAGTEKLSFIFLDRIYDPQNLGAIIRTAACFGKFAVVMPKHKACEVTESALRVACGGENFIPIAMVSNLTNALIEIKKAGYWVTGAVVEKGEDISRVALSFPLCFVLGSEGGGIRHGLQKYLDTRVCIPMRGASLSFNVSGACSIFCYEITKQKGVRSLHLTKNL